MQNQVPPTHPETRPYGTVYCRLSCQQFINNAASTHFALEAFHCIFIKCLPPLEQASYMLGLFAMLYALC